MILLDTHVWPWLNGAVEHLSPEVLERLSSSDIDIYFSAASAWEIGIKLAAGKLSLPAHPEEYILRRIVENGIRPLPIHQQHALRAAALPLHHKDPFDRMLVAQAQIENLTLMTVDRQMASYDVPILWADRPMTRNDEGTEPSSDGPDADTERSPAED